MKHEVRARNLRWFIIRTFSAHSIWILLSACSCVNNQSVVQMLVCAGVQRWRQREQLQQCLDKQAVTPPSEAQPVPAPLEQLLPQLQVQLHSPVTKRLHSV